MKYLLALNCVGEYSPKRNSLNDLGANMLNSKRHKQAKVQGYQARLNNYEISQNPYLYLGSKGLVYAGLWESGWKIADENCKKEGDLSKVEKSNYLQ